MHLQTAVFKGNPAAVCPLENWLEDNLMQSIAMENNLSETAFIVDQGDQYQIRWFTPEVEVDLCGHATLAAAYVVFRFIKSGTNSVRFSSKSGHLNVTQREQLVCLDFPVMEAFPALLRTHCSEPSGRNLKRSVLAARDYLVVYENEEEIRMIQPDFALLKQLDRMGVIITSPGVTSDFVSRFFAPEGWNP